MARLIWSPEAADNLEAICDYIGDASPHYARLLAKRVMKIVAEIADFPMAGRVVPEYHFEGLRERIAQNYRIVYQVKTDAVVILAIVHGARLLPGSQEDTGE